MCFLKRTESGTIRIMGGKTVLVGFSENDLFYKVQDRQYKSDSILLGILS